MSERGESGERALPAELVIGLELLERRLELLHVHSRRVEPREWDSLPEEVAALIPRWLKAVVEHHAVVGAILEIRDPYSHRPRGLSFYDAADYRIVLEDGSLWREVMGCGFFPFAAESNGDAWVVELEKGAQSEVHVLELSDWGGGPPTQRNGLRFACTRLELLLCHMAVSSETYEKASSVPRCIKWFPS